MEPVTHVLTGACVARSGLNRKAAYTTLAMAIAAQFPDIDTLWELRGPVEGFQHHRGITHTFLGVPFEAAFLLGLFWLFHQWRVRKAQRLGDRRAVTNVPVRWGLLYCFIVIALLSHLLLDFTNNYGLRPFFPFNPHWYAASIVFIFDPWIFAMLVFALALPAIFHLVNREIGARDPQALGRRIAQVALGLILVYYGFRTFEHTQAVQIAEQQSFQEQPEANAVVEAVDPNAPLPSPPPAPILQPQRVLASPDPINPFRWYTVTDFGPLYHLDEVDTLHNQFKPGAGVERKINVHNLIVQAAFHSPLGRAYLDWSPMPWIDELSSDTSLTGQPSVVQFRDPRFMGDAMLLRSATQTPLTATVELDSNNHVTAQSMGGKFEH